MAPALTGVALFREAMMGATPALAPGSMSMFGLLGLLYLLMTRSMASDLSEGQT
jgi:hypothetical protein